MKRMLLLLPLLLLALSGSASANAATIPVTSLSGSFSATNPSVVHTSDGVHFGPYANGGTAGGSLYYSGANGLTLGSIAALAFTVVHNSTDDSPIAAPYLRIFLEGDTHDVIFDATECATVVPTENVANHFDVVAGNVRYDDDACDGIPPDQQPWADVIAAHGSEVVSGIYVTAGFTGGLDLSALLRDLTVNADTFCFYCVPDTQIVTPSITPTPVVPVIHCKGDKVRFIHAPKRRGEKFLRARATLRDKKLRVKGRRIRVDLRHHPEANYNIEITSKYLRHGRMHRVRSQRHLSVVCA